MMPMWRGNSGRSERYDVGRMCEDMAFLGRTRGVVVSKQKALDANLARRLPSVIER
jgi:hypothetical protein